MAITSGDKGTVITATITGLVLTGGTVSLLVSKTNPTTGHATPSSYAMTVTSATTATYTTTGTEFPTGGTYAVKVSVSFGGGTSVFSSPYQSIEVNF